MSFRAEQNEAKNLGNIHVFAIEILHFALNDISSNLLIHISLFILLIALLHPLLFQAEDIPQQADDEQEQRNANQQTLGDGSLIDYSKSVMALEGMSSLENANIFFPKSFSEAPM